MSETQNVPDVIRQEAKARALKIIEDNKDCISYIRPEDLETQSFFLPVASAIRPTADDFYESIPKIGFMAKPQLVNLIAEKAGVNIIRTDTTKRGQYIWVAHCYGEKRQPDGTMRPDDASFEWDAELRAEIDFLNQPGKYNTLIVKRQHVLDYAKIGESRSVTGAQHALIHKLAHVARSFKTPQEMKQGMLVSRIDRNNEAVIAIAKDPQTRLAVMNQMTGATEQVFGPAKQITRTVDVASGEVIEQQAPAAEEGQVAIFPESEAESEQTPIDKLKAILRTQLEKIPADLVIKQGNVRELIQKSLDKKDATEIEINAWIDRCTQYFQNVEGKNGGAS